MRRPPRLRIARLAGLAAATIVAFLLMAGLAQALPNTIPDNTGMVDFPGAGGTSNAVAVRSIQQFGSNVWVGGIFDEIDDQNGNKVADAGDLAVFDATTGTLQPGVHLPLVTDAGGSPEIYDMSVGPNGLLYFTGNFDHVDGQQRNGAAAVDASTGQLVAGFHPNAGAGNAILATPNAIYVGTDRLQSFQLNGSPTPGFSPPTAIIDASLRAHTTLPQFRDIALYGNTLVAACQCDSLSDANGARPVKAVVEIDAASGSWVNWAPGNLANSGPNNSGAFGVNLIVHAYPTTGAPTIYLAAGGSDFTAAYDFASGTQRFKTDTSGSSQAITWYQGMIVVGGHFDWTESPAVDGSNDPSCHDNASPNTACYHTPKLAAMNATTGVVVLSGGTPWNPGICCKYNGVWTLLTGNDGQSLHVGGEFTEVGGTWHETLPDPSGTNWSLGGNPSNQQFYARLSGPVATTVPLTVEKAVSSGATGTVTSTPSGINCNTGCRSSGPTDFNVNASVTLTATPTAGNTFIGWSSAESGFNCPGTGTCTVTMDMSRMVVANFAPISFQLSVTKAGTGTGTVTSDVSGINCGATCSSFFPQNTVVTLTATPGPNSTFAGGGWSGGGCSGIGTCVVTMDQAKNVTATFISTTHYLTVTRSGAGAGTVMYSPTQTCGCTHKPFTSPTVTLTTSPAGGSVFNGWTGGGCSGLATTCIVTMDQDQSVDANFALAKNVILTGAGSGGGTVTSSNGAMNCIIPITPGPTCNTAFAQNSTVTIAATADASSVFTGWSGSGGNNAGCTGTAPCTFSMGTMQKTVTATFQPGLLLSVAPAGAGGGTITSDVNGINCGMDCSENYLSGTTVTLFASSDVNSTFTGWGGDCSGTGSCQVTMDQARNVTATFTPVQRGLTVHVAGQGTVSDNPGPISCVGPATCTASYQHGTDVQLVAYPVTNWAFTGWTGDCSGFDTTPNGDPICIVSMTAARDVTGTFERISRSVSVSKAGSGTGTVTSDVPGIDCGDDCFEGYNQGDSVVLTATADPGSIFTGWSGSCTGTGTCNLTIDAAKNVVATFELLHTLTVATDGGGTGNITSDVGGIDCPATNCVATNLTHNTHVILTASPDPGSVVAGWTENGCSASSLTCDVTMDADTTVTVTFQSATTLTVSTAGDGGGTVTSPPGNEISCPGTCSHDFAQNASVTLHAAADGSSTFIGWSSGDPGFSCPGTGDCTVTMDQARSVTATFQSVFSLTVTKAGSGTGTVTSLSPNLGIDCGSTCQAGFQEGASVTLHAAPDASMTFNGWSSGDPGFSCPGTGDCTVTMDQARTVTATFGANVILTVTKSGTGTGTVTSLSPNTGITCGSTCQASFPQGTAVTLHAAPDANMTFVSWSGGGCTGTADCVVTLNSATSVNAQFNGAPPTGCTGTITENQTCVAYNGWVGVTDPNASGGAYRTSSTKSDKATWKSPVSTSVSWLTYMGPDQGKAKVTIDGASQGTIDLYAASPTWTTKTFSGLASKAHTVIVTALGTKRTTSTGTNVRLDALTAGSTTVQESDGSIQYDTWKTIANVNAVNGAYRSATVNTATATVTFTGTSIQWISVKGKSFGIATVLVDGVSQGQVDLYRNGANLWNTPVFTSATLPAGPHTLTIKVLGQKNAAATSTKVPVDGFVIHS